MKKLIAAAEKGKGGTGDMNITGELQLVDARTKSVIGVAKLNGRSS